MEHRLLGATSISEIEDNSPGITEIVLIGIIESIFEIGVQVIDLCWANCHHVADGNIYASAEGHRKSVV